MLDLINQFSQPGQLLLYPLAKTLSTLKACLLASKHRWCIGYKMDSGRVCESMPGLVKVHARQLLKEKSDLTESADLLAKEQVYVDGMNAQKTRRKDDQWNKPDGLCPVQLFQE